MSNKLVEDNMNLVYFLIQTYYPTFIKDEDVIQSGMCGLCKAATTWSEDMSAFSSYASRCVLNEIREEFRKRKKFNGVLSLEYEVKDGDGDTCNFSEIIAGDTDVDFVDLDGFYERLTPRQKEILELKRLGFSGVEIAKEIGISHQAINQQLRTMRTIWRETNGN